MLVVNAVDALLDRICVQLAEPGGRGVRLSAGALAELAQHRRDVGDRRSWGETTSPQRSRYCAGPRPRASAPRAPWRLARAGSRRSAAQRTYERPASGPSEGAPMLGERPTY